MDKVAFSILGIDVMWYGVFIAIGMIIAVTLGNKEGDRLGIGENTIVDLSIFLLPLSIIGARLYYVIFNWDYYSGNVGEILNIRGGGLAIHGGLLAGIIVTYVFSKIKKIDFWKLADSIVVGVPLAQAIGRWGNFVNQEAHGGPTNLPWGIMVDGQKVHPTFLYESIWNIGVFLFIFTRRKKKDFDGRTFVEYVILYSIGRGFIESLRTDSLMFGPFRVAQLISLAGILLGLAFFFILKKRKNQN